MNKNEFYKQLMSEYSFDADKIRENAKRGKNARQKLQPMYIGMTAAAVRWLSRWVRWQQLTLRRTTAFL